MSPSVLYMRLGSMQQKGPGRAPLKVLLKGFIWPGMDQGDHCVLKHKYHPLFFLGVNLKNNPLSS